MDGPIELKESEIAPVFGPVVEQTGFTEELKSLAVDTVNAEHEYTPEQYRKVLWKIDLCLLPLMWLCYGTQQADKVSLSTQATFGIRQDTHLHGQQYSCVIVMCVAFAENWASLMVLRALQGAFECTISPAFLLITGAFYTHREHTLRSIIWGTANSGMEIILSLVSYGIGTSAEKHPDGLAPWKGISFFLGGLTILLSVLAYVLLGTPREVRWLSANDRRAAAARVVSNQTGSDREKHGEWKWEQVRVAFKDPQTYFFFFVTVANAVPNGGTTSFGNLVYVSFGYTALDTLVKGTIPQDVVCIAWFLFVGIATLYRPGLRFYLMMVSVVPGFVGMLALALLPKDGLLWVRWGMFLMTVTARLPGLLIWTFLPSNVAGRTKKTVTGIVLFVAYCFGNAVGAQVFQAKEAPRYIPAITICAIMYALEFVGMGAWRTYYVFANKRRARKIAELGFSEEDSAMHGRLNGESDMTDYENIHFRYSV